MSDVIKVVLADDHPVVRRGLAAIVNVEDDIAVVGEAENGAEALELVHTLQPDVVLMDLQMPVLDGVAATQRIRAEAPQTKVIILTTFKDDDYIYAGIAAGARGYLLKDAPPTRLVEAIRAAHRGESLLNPEVAARLLERFSSLLSPPAPAPVEADPPDIPAVKVRPPKLTPRELDVLGLMARGLRNKEIADDLVIAERTVKIHVGNILGKLNATNRTEAVAVALKMGLVSDISPD
ncbi:MAG: Transcriptional regulatory protein LiaR [Anaerolineae bacterium]|nr:Transcriptional regulatory protein LiaR [Anaerolineae bacterium]